jgi:predicted Zn-ribbon and HTH transcriptional regulator
LKPDSDLLVVGRAPCQNCGATQSYDEVVEKRKQCPNCHVAYMRRSDWRKHAKQFLKRQEDFVLVSPIVKR